MKRIYFAGGCFWGTGHFFSLIHGVSGVKTGYANGFTPDPSYEEVYTDSTGYAETVEVCYRPDSVSLDFLLEMFFAIIDPLSVNRQGEDVGTRYRTGVYYTDPEDLPVIREAFSGVSARLGKPLAVECAPLVNFYPAEERHQDYLRKNPGGYCHIPLKAFRYVTLLQDLKNLIEGEEDGIARMAEASALIHERVGSLWTGFYIVKGEFLVLGPFQGSPACLRIGFGKGVCGTAWREDRTVVVPDVDAFPGHIACSSLSRSEIVVPCRDRDRKVVAVLDLDSDSLSYFDSDDALWLEKAASIVFG